jgi:hypothetical protein
VERANGDRRGAGETRLKHPPDREANVGCDAGVVDAHGGADPAETGPLHRHARARPGRERHLRRGRRVDRFVEDDRGRELACEPRGAGEIARRERLLDGRVRVALAIPPPLSVSRCTRMTWRRRCMPVAVTSGVTSSSSSRRGSTARIRITQGSRVGERRSSAR